MKVYPVQYDAYWICGCGSALMYLQGLDSRPRQMTCVNPDCEHFRVAVFEPVFEAQAIPAEEAEALRRLCRDDGSGARPDEPKSELGARELQPDAGTPQWQRAWNAARKRQALKAHEPNASQCS